MVLIKSRRSLDQQREEQKVIRQQISFIYNTIRDQGLHYEIKENYGCSVITIGRNKNRVSHINRDLTNDGDVAPTSKLEQSKTESEDSVTMETFKSLQNRFRSLQKDWQRISEEKKKADDTLAAIRVEKEMSSKAADESRELIEKLKMQYEGSREWSLRREEKNENHIKELQGTIEFFKSKEQSLNRELKKKEKISEEASVQVDKREQDLANQILMLNKSLELKDNLLNEATLKAKEEEDKVDEFKKALELKEREISESINHFTDKEILNEKLRKIGEELEEKEKTLARVKADLDDHIDREALRTVSEDERQKKISSQKRKQKTKCTFSDKTQGWKKPTHVLLDTILPVNVPVSCTNNFESSTFSPCFRVDDENEAKPVGLPEEGLPQPQVGNHPCDELPQDAIARQSVTDATEPLKKEEGDTGTNRNDGKEVQVSRGNTDSENNTVLDAHNDVSIESDEACCDNVGPMVNFRKLHLLGYENTATSRLKNAAKWEKLLVCTEPSYLHYNHCRLDAEDLCYTCGVQWEYYRDQGYHFTLNFFEGMTEPAFHEKLDGPRDEKWVAKCSALLGRLRKELKANAKHPEPQGLEPEAAESLKENLEGYTEDSMGVERYLWTKLKRPNDLTGNAPALAALYYATDWYGIYLMNILIATGQKHFSIETYPYDFDWYKDWEELILCDSGSGNDKYYNIQRTGKPRPAMSGVTPRNHFNFSILAE